MTTKNNTAFIYSRESLQQEQRQLKRVIKQQENELRLRVQKLPGEVLYAGADAILPGAFTGRITDKILSASRNFINKSVVRRASAHTSRLVTAAKQAGLFALFKFAYKVFIRRKR